MLRRIQNRGEGRRHKREHRTEHMLWKVEKGICGLKLGKEWQDEG